MLQCKVSRQLTQWFWRRRDFVRFLSIFLAWRPSWSCDLDHLYKLSFPLPKDAPHKNLALWLAQAVSEEKDVFKSGERTTDAGPWVYFKLTLWAWRLRWAIKKHTKNNKQTHTHTHTHNTTHTKQTKKTKKKQKTKKTWINKLKKTNKKKNPHD